MRLAALHDFFVVAAVLRGLMTPGQPLVEVVDPDHLGWPQSSVFRKGLVAPTERQLWPELPEDPHIAARGRDLAQILGELRVELLLVCRRPARGATRERGIQVRPRCTRHLLIRSQ